MEETQNPPRTEEKRNPNGGLETTLIMPSYKRTFSSNQLGDILRKAEAMQDFSEAHIIDEEIARYGIPELNKLDYQVLMELANTSGIKPKYIKEVLDIFYPSEEQEFQDIQETNSYPSNEFIMNFYLKMLKESLKGKIYSEDISFSWEYPANLVINFIERKRIKSKLPFFNERTKILKKENKIGFISYNDYHGIINTNCYSPLMLRIFKEPIEQIESTLNKIFKSKKSFKNNFKIEYSI